MRASENYKQGVYNPVNKEKYAGTYPVIFRSEPELFIFQWLDRNPNVITWTSESVAIPYIKPTDGQTHRYMVDFSCNYRNPDGSVKKFLIEYKPKKFTKPPVQTKRMSNKTFLELHEAWVLNQAKWKAALQYARAKNADFFVLTEDHIGLSNEKKTKPKTKRTRIKIPHSGTKAPPKY